MAKVWCEKKKEEKMFERVKGDEIKERDERIMRR